MANVSLLRLDLLDSVAPGNKLFKLTPALQQARQQGIRRIVSFGGAWSNHLHALAAIGYREGLQTVGIVRGNDGGDDTPTLRDARAWGMVLQRVSRSEYRRRNDPDYLAMLQRRYSPCLVLTEGGASVDGARGCLEIARLIGDLGYTGRSIVLAVGTGTTLAGVAAGLPPDREVIGVSALKGAADLGVRTGDVLQGLAAEDGAAEHAAWQILHREHCGGFARVNAELRDFMLAFEAVHRVPLDPVYTGKVLLAIHRRLASGEWSADEPLLAIHSGGLQGRRGYPWLTGP